MADAPIQDNGPTVALKSPVMAAYRPQERTVMLFVEGGNCMLSLQEAADLHGALDGALKIARGQGCGGLHG